MDVDDLLVAQRIDPSRVELLELVADRDDHIGSVEPEVDIVVLHEPDSSECEGVVVREDPLAVEGGGHRYPKRLGEAAKAAPRVGPGGAVAGEHDRVDGGPQDRRRSIHLRGRRLIGPGDVDRQRYGVDRSGRLLDIFGYREVDRARTLGLGEFEGFADHFGNCAGCGDEGRPLGDRCEHRHQVHTLVRLLEAPVHSDLGGEGDQRRGVGGGIGGAEQEVDGARPERGGAHTGPPSEPSVRLRHK